MKTYFSSAKTCFVRAAGILTIALVLLSNFNAQAATKYWDPTGGALGGSGVWSAQAQALFSTSLSGGSLTAAATTDDNVFQGSPGTIGLGFSPTANSLTFNTTGYTITNASSQTITGPLTIGSGVTLNLLNPSVTGGQILSVGNIFGFDSTAQIIIQGSCSSNKADRINISSANSSISVPTTILDTGTGVAGYVATATGAVIGGNITNNSTAMTDIGATSGNDLTVAAVITGSAPVSFGAGNSGGAGKVTLSQQNNYTGATFFNASSSGTIKLGISNGLSTNSDVTWTSGNGGIFDLNGFDQTIGSLQSTNSGGYITNSAAGSGTNTLTISGSTTPLNSFDQTINDNGIRKIALTRSGTGSIILSGANTFSGPITITGGEIGFNKDSAFGAVPGSFTPGAIVIDGGKLTIETKSGNGQSYMLNTNRGIELGSTPGTSISIVSSGALTNLGILADKPGSSGILLKQGGGALILGGANTYSGNTFINNGTLQLTNGNNRLPTSTIVNIGQTNSSNLGSLDLNGNNQTIAGLDSGAGTYGGSHKNTLTNSSVTVATLTVSGNTTNAYGDGSTTNSGIIVGPISFVINGGTQILGDTNAYTGTTTVSNGTLLVNGFISTSPVNVFGGTLGGFGTLGGEVTNALGGTLAPGAGTNGAGTVLTTGGDLTLLSGSTNIFQLSLDYSTNDSVVSGGTITYGGKLIVTTNGMDVVNNFTNGQKFTLFVTNGVTGGFAGSFTTSNLPPLSSGLIWSNSLLVDGSIEVISNAVTTPPPVAGLTNVTSSIGVAPLSVTFSNLSSGATNYLWSFGDGGTLTTDQNTNVTYSYTVPGTYTNSLTAYGLGGTNVATNLNNVVIYAPVVAALTNVTSATGFTPLSVTFSNLSSGATNYYWNFGDSSSLTTNQKTNVIHNYTTGTYTNILAAYGYGGTNSATNINNIVVKPLAVLNNPVMIGGTNFAFSGTNGPAGVQYSILTSTNVTMNTTNWTPLVTNSFNSDGSYNYTNMAPTNKAAFFRLKSPP
jgi:autotransporter-associated beta strand protein